MTILKTQESNATVKNIELLHVKFTYDPCLFCTQDIDQCSNNNGGCEQICINQSPEHACSCYIGFVLNADKTTCSGMYLEYLVEVLA